jgi:hypothetical protein
MTYIQEYEALKKQSAFAYPARNSRVPDGAVSFQRSALSLFRSILRAFADS